MRRGRLEWRLLPSPQQNGALFLEQYKCEGPARPFFVSFPDGSKLALVGSFSSLSCASFVAFRSLAAHRCSGGAKATIKRRSNFRSSSSGLPRTVRLRPITFSGCAPLPNDCCSLIEYGDEEGLRPQPLHVLRSPSSHRTGRFPAFGSRRRFFNLLHLLCRVALVGPRVRPYWACRHSSRYCRQ